MNEEVLGAARIIRDEKAKEARVMQDILRELRVMNRLKAIEILSGASIAAIGQDYAFLINISTQWVGDEVEEDPVRTDA